MSWPSPSRIRVNNKWSYTSTVQYVIMLLCLISTRSIFIWSLVLEVHVKWGPYVTMAWRMLRLRTNGGLLWKRWWTFGFWCRGVSYPYIFLVWCIISTRKNFTWPLVLEEYSCLSSTSKNVIYGRTRIVPFLLAWLSLDLTFNVT
jgi:hypothetical protein